MQHNCATRTIIAMKTVEQIEAAEARYKELSKEFAQFRSTTRLICWLRFRIEERLLETGPEEDVTTGVYIGLLTALYRLEQFEDILKDEEPGNKAVMDILSLARILQKEDLFTDNKTEQ